MSVSQYIAQQKCSIDPRAESFLTHVWRGGEWAYFWTPDGPQYFSAKYQEMRRKKLSFWFPLARRWPAVPGAWESLNVYFGVHSTLSAGKRWQRSTIHTVAAVNCVFAEFDGKQFGTKSAMHAHLDTLPLYPTAIIDSGGGLHAYWLLEEPQLIDDNNRAYFVRVQAAWVELMGGDDGAKDLARVLRLPGYQNRKAHYAPDFPTVSLVEFSEKRLFPFADVAKIVADRLAEIEADERERRALDAARERDVAAGAAEDLLDWCVSHAHAGSRHNLALWLAGRLKAEGLTQWAADSVLKEFARRVNAAGTRELDATEMESVAKYIWRTA